MYINISFSFLVEDGSCSYVTRQIEGETEIVQAYPHHHLKWDGIYIFFVSMHGIR